MTQFIDFSFFAKIVQSGHESNHSGDDARGARDLRRIEPGLLFGLGLAGKQINAADAGRFPPCRADCGSQGRQVKTEFVPVAAKSGCIEVVFKAQNAPRHAEFFGRPRREAAKNIVVAGEDDLIELSLGKVLTEVQHRPP